MHENLKKKKKKLKEVLLQQSCKRIKFKILHSMKLIRLKSLCFCTFLKEKCLEKNCILWKKRNKTFFFQKSVEKHETFC